MNPLSFPSIEQQIEAYASLRKSPQGSAIPELYATFTTVTDKIKDYMQSTDSHWGAAEIQEFTSQINQITSKLNPENFSHWKMIKSSDILARIVTIYNNASNSQDISIEQAIKKQEPYFNKSICSEHLQTAPIVLFTANQPLSLEVLNRLTLDDKMKYSLLQFDALLKEENYNKKTDPHLGKFSDTAAFLRHDADHLDGFETLLMACSELEWDLYGELRELYQAQQELNVKNPRLGKLLEVALFIIFHESSIIFHAEAPDVKGIRQDISGAKFLSMRLSDSRSIEDCIKKLDYIINNTPEFKTRSETYKFLWKDLEGLLKTALDKNDQPFLGTFQKDQTPEEKMDMVRDAYSRFWQEVLDILPKTS